MSARFAYTNLADTGTLTNSTAATGYPAANIQHPFRAKTWRSTGVTDEWLKWNLGSAQSVTMMAIVNTNLTSAATVYFCGHASDLGNATANWHGVATVDETITIPASGMVIKYFTGASKQWWFLGVAPAGAGTYVEMGRVWFGTYYATERTFTNALSNTKMDLSQMAMTIGGQKHIDIRDQYHAFSIPFSNITQTQKNSMLTMFNAAGTHRDIVVSLDPTGNLNDWSYYGKFAAPFSWDGVSQTTSGLLYNISVPFEESL